MAMFSTAWNGSGGATYGIPVKVLGLKYVPYDISI